MLKRLTFRNLCRLAVLSLVLIYVGKKSNEFVMKANDGAMPVLMYTDQLSLSMLFDEDHTPLTAKTRYILLADIFPMHAPDEWSIKFRGASSIGDTLIWSGWVLEDLVILGFLIFIPVGLTRKVCLYKDVPAKLWTKIKMLPSGAQTETVV